MKNLIFVFSAAAVACALLMAFAPRVAQVSIEGNLVADTGTLAMATGMAANKCCESDVNDCYGGPAEQGNCVGQLPWKCTCTNTGVGTWVLGEAKVGSHCKSTPDTSDCEEVDVPQCYRLKNGVCDDNGGPWSWWGWCTTCGPGGFVLGPWVGSYTLCTAASTDCGTVPVGE